MPQPFPKVEFREPYSQKGRIALFQMTFPGKGFTTFSRKDFGVASKPMVMLLRGDVGEWLFEKKVFDLLAKKYAEKLYDRKAYDERFGKWLALSESLKQKAFQVYESDLSKLSDSGLFAKFTEFEKMVNDFWNCCIFIDMFDAGFDLEETERINKAFGFGKQEIQTLLTPTEPSYVQEKQLALYSLIEEPGEEKMNDFIKNYFWVKTDYYDFGRYSRDDLLRETGEVRKADWKRERANFAGSRDRLKQEQEQILGSKGLKENPFWFFKELTFWRDERKKFNFVGLFALTQLVLEMLRRKGLKESYLRFLTLEEVLHGFPSVEELRKRASFPIVWYLDYRKSIVYAGANSEQMFGEILGKGEVKGDLRGMTASLGTAAGIVKVVLSPKEFPKFRDGDILVTHMTRPEFVPIMKKAAAIVTDEGGITCHAAIVSRELEIPCVVGTRIATKVLVDGDKVEVRANHGLVRKLS
jgi:phosphohistidine swiveling domain-containing protein